MPSGETRCRRSDRFETALGSPDIWVYFEQNPEEGLLFGAAVTDLSTPIIQDAASVIDTSDVESAVDVGGTNGAFGYELLARNAKLRGIVLDLPTTLPGVRADAERLGLHPAAARRSPATSAHSSRPVGQVDLPVTHGRVRRRGPGTTGRSRYRDLSSGIPSPSIRMGRGEDGAATSSGANSPGGVSGRARTTASGAPPSTPSSPAGVEVRHRPPAVGERALGVLVLPTEHLHLTVDAHRTADDDVHRLLLVRTLRRQGGKLTGSAGRTHRSALARPA
ncbi:methyltransferase [Pseudonocardia adelaidensis]|uniref:methyltransferase n=1 Tax=Pseudonocardia adelaidensis TaxID=648754 RepID=UPI003CD075C0